MAGHTIGYPYALAKQLSATPDRSGSQLLRGTVWFLAIVFLPVVVALAIGFRMHRRVDPVVVILVAVLLLGVVAVIVATGVWLYRASSKRPVLAVTVVFVTITIPHADRVVAFLVAWHERLSGALMASTGSALFRAVSPECAVLVMLVIGLAVAGFVRSLTRSLHAGLRMALRSSGPYG